MRAVPAGPPLFVVPPSDATRLTGTVRWNGKAASDASLVEVLEATQRMQPQPELHLRPDAAARYDRVDDVLAITKRAHVTRMGFVGNENYRQF